MSSRRIEAIDGIAGFAKSTPHAPALVNPCGVTLSYGRFWEEVSALAEQIRLAGIGPDETVAVLLEQGALQVIAVAGVLCHCICFPLQAKTTVAEVRASLERLSAVALIVAPEFEDEAEAAAAMGLTVFVARDSEQPHHWQVRPSLSSPGKRGVPYRAALVLVTSASTSSPKAVPLSAENLDAGIRSRVDSLRLTAADRMLLMTSLCHIVGIENTFAQLMVGGVVIATAGFDSTQYLSWLNSLRPTWYDSSPTIHQAALAQLEHEPPSQSVSLRFVQSAGASLPGEVRERLERALQIPVFNDYGMTEACPIAVDAYLPGGRVANSAGRSCGLEIGIANTSEEFLPPGEEGEIVVRGPAVFSGYVGNPEANQALWMHGWFRTGDAGRLDEAGNLFITGRLKEMINRGGEKILPAELDIVLASHPAVLEAAAFSVPHPTLGEDMACAIVLRPNLDQPPSAAELHRFAAQRLASFKVPRRIYFVEQIPRGELGKPQRWLLTEGFGNRHRPTPPPVELEGREFANDVVDVRNKLREIWGRILDYDNIGFDEDFFSAGGDSLEAMNMLAEVDKRFGSHTASRAADFLDDPTLSKLADLLTETPLPRPGDIGSSELRIFPLREGRAERRLFCIPADEDEGLYFRRLATYLLGEVDLFAIRPLNTWFERSPSTFEHNGALAAKLIREMQPEGPYFVGGYCFGGIVAAEAVRQLIQQGHDARLVLIDVFLPGYPLLLRDAGTWVQGMRDEWSLRRQGKPSNILWNLRRFARRLSWSLAVLLQRVTPIEHFPGALARLRRIEDSYFPAYRARPIAAPMIHFLCMEKADAVDGASLLSWREMAALGIEEHFLPLDHDNILHESNLPRIVIALLKWMDIPAHRGTRGASSEK